MKHPHVFQGGSSDRVLTIGHASNGFVDLVEKSFVEFHFDRDWDFPLNISSRGVEKLTDYFFRDDGLMLWSAISEYVNDIVNIFYLTDDDVLEDFEIQEWIDEIYK